MNYWFIADTHLGHIRCACEFRGFNSVEEMDDLIINNWNSVISPHDIVYHLGDFAWGTNVKKYSERLNGQIHLIVGNHDNLNSCIKSGAFVDVKVTKSITIDDKHIFLSHYAHRVWDRSHYGVYALFGHSHGRLEPYGKSFDVGVDGNNFMPWSFDDVCNKMESLPDNKDKLK